METVRHLHIKLDAQGAQDAETIQAAVGNLSAETRRLYRKRAAAIRKKEGKK